MIYIRPIILFTKSIIFKKWQLDENQFAGNRKRKKSEISRIRSGHLFVLSVKRPYSGARKKCCLLQPLLMIKRPSLSSKVNFKSFDHSHSFSHHWRHLGFLFEATERGGGRSIGSYSSFTSRPWRSPALL